MKLSVIIVNYNVQYFLEQCLHSVFDATKNVETEVFVVDNNSVDGSTAMVKLKFPQVKLIESKINTGFSKGNNIAIKESCGEYVLLLNPDTLVEEDTFEKVVDFMDKHPVGGGLGVKMVDGKGVFLPESKRSLPTPLVAFYKIFGLSNLFPKSKRFGRYHLGHLSNEENHEVEILSGAFMMLRKSVLDKVGLLDEQFFMYGEDVDLSYRIIKEGYKNYYCADTRIIHYKGESTKKSSVNYVFIFYNAMIIFAKKHFSNKNAAMFSFLIKIAIYLRASIAIASRWVKQLILPVGDFTVIYGGIYLIKNFWEQAYKQNSISYPEFFMQYEIPAFILIWMGCVYYSGGYKKPLKLTPMVRGAIAGTLLILIGYSLLSENYRFSRAILILSSLWSIVSLSLTRIVAHFIKYKNLNIEKDVQKRVVIVGSSEEIKRVEGIMGLANMSYKFLGKVSEKENSESNEFLGGINQLGEVIQIHRINEVVFCAKDISAQKIISNMEFSRLNIEYKIAPPESHFIIGSNSIDSPGELYLIDINSLNKTQNKRNKRVFDFLSACTLLITSPILFLLYKKPSKFLQNTWEVALGVKSWVGYSKNFNEDKNLPLLKKGILSPTDQFNFNELDADLIKKLNIKYVKDYSINSDLKILVKGITRIAS
ncbi:MAG: GT2 family glycosyltransferase [Saprospiraceae bacterium]|jgi:GT2 family glycosyltransferase